MSQVFYSCIDVKGDVLRSEVSATEQYHHWGLEVLGDPSATGITKEDFKLKFLELLDNSRDKYFFTDAEDWVSWSLDHVSGNLKFPTFFGMILNEFAICPDAYAVQWVAK
jgi:hypothetical protein